MPELKNTTGNSSMRLGNKKEPLQKVIARRNERLIEFFKTLGYNVRLIGDEQKPAIIFNEKSCLSCFVKNFDLILTDKPFNGNKLKFIKLRNEIEINPELTNSVKDWFINSEHRTIYKIKLNDDNGLYLSGYNFIDQKNGKGKYPVFSRYKPKIYFDSSYAQTICDEYLDDSYDLIVI